MDNFKYEIDVIQTAIGHGCSWVATDFDGEIYGFKKEPIQRNDMWNNIDCEVVLTKKLPNVCENWMDSLVYIGEEKIGIVDQKKEKVFTATIGIHEEEIKRPKHYTSHPSGIEAIVILQHHNFNVGNAMKYLWRQGLKDGEPSEKDLKKAIEYINFEIERIRK